MNKKIKNSSMIQTHNIFISRTENVLYSEKEPAIVDPMNYKIHIYTHVCLWLTPLIMHVKR